MKIVVLGATGFVGSKVVSEALSRGHQVTAVSRRVDKTVEREGLKVLTADISNRESVVLCSKGADAVISCYNPVSDGVNKSKDGLATIKIILKGLVEAGVKRVLFTGGAGSLEVEPGLQLVDSPGFPKEWRPGATTTREVLYILKEECKIDWTFLSPSANMFRGERTGVFRIGGDQLLKDEKGDSSISVEDYAVAMIDELENQAHNLQRFTVGY